MFDWRMPILFSMMEFNVIGGFATLSVGMFRRDAGSWEIGNCYFI